MINKELRNFFFFIASGIALVVVIDMGLGACLEFLHGRMKGGERARAHYAINKSAADVYIFGSSRALHHYDPSILQDSLRLSVYNAGRPAQTMLYHLPVFKMILKRKKPKLIILDVNENEFVQEARKYDLLNSLLPYYQADETVREVINRVKPGYQYFAWSRTLPFNSSLFSILFRSITSKGEKDSNGYVFMKGRKIHQLVKLHNCDSHNEFDPVIIRAFEEFVALCRKNNIQLIAVTSPRFLVADCPRIDLEKVKEVMKHLHVDYVDFSNNKKYVENLQFMYDESHLNHEGSIEFTRDVAGYINGMKK
jgi:hypothetical protein